MSKILKALGRKILGLSIIFNSLLCIFSVANLLAGYYASGSGWHPYAPYLLDGSLFWTVILTSILNIIPAKLVGDAKIRRVLFHHYVYGFLVIFISVFLGSLFMPRFLSMLLIRPHTVETINSQSLSFYAGLFFIYGGITLVVDDLYDVSNRTRRFFDWLKTRTYRVRKILRTVHFLSGITSFYVSISVLLWFIKNYTLVSHWPLWLLSHIFFITSLLINSVWALKTAKEKTWFR